MSRLGRISIRRLLSEKLISIDEQLSRDECLRDLNNQHVKFYHGRIGRSYGEKLLLDHHKKSASRKWLNNQTKFKLKTLSETVFFTKITLATDLGLF